VQCSRSADAPRQCLERGACFRISLSLFSCTSVSTFQYPDLRSVADALTEWRIRDGRQMASVNSKAIEVAQCNCELLNVCGPSSKDTLSRSSE
jgi:hypothetical protein